MQGTVTPDREAVITIILSNSGRQISVDAVIDTGFTGYLTLPRALIQSLALPFHSQASATLADGTNISLARYEAVVIWDGQPRDIMALETEGGPLLGMSLLHGSRLTMDIVDGGRVDITPL